MAALYPLALHSLEWKERWTQAVSKDSCTGIGELLVVAHA